MLYRKQKEKYKELIFDINYMKYIKELEKYQSSLTYTRCAMTKAMTAERIEEMRLSDAEKCAIPAQNLDRLFKACEVANVPRIYIGECELVGADEAKQPKEFSEGWASIWLVKDLIDGYEEYRYRFAAGCGNCDQTQTQNTEYFIPPEYIDKAWDVATREEVPIEPFVKRMVVTRKYKSKEENRRW